MKRSGIVLAVWFCASIAGADVYKDGGKDIITYATNLPAKRLPNAKIGLIVGFHGRGGNEKQLIDGAVSALQKAGLRDDFAVIGLKSKEDGWTDKDDEPVLKFMAWAIKTHGIDPRRVYGVGFSSGAYYLNKFVPIHSDVFAGAITYVGGQGGLPKVEHPEAKSELYWIVGQADQTVKAESVRPNMLASKAAGYRFVYREIATLAHEVYKDPPLEDAMQWLKAIRNKEVPLAAEDQAFVDKFAEASKAASLLDSAGTWQRVVHIGGPAVSPIVLQGLGGERDGAQIHAARACTQMMFDGKVVEALAALLEDKDARVRSQAIAGLVFQGRWNYALAQDALCRHARNAKAPVGERKAAILGLGEVAKLDFLGSFQFKNVGWTLVELLDDEDGGVRAAAFAALTPAKAAVDYAPGMAKRDAAMSKWTAWAEKVYGPKATP